MSKPNPHQLIKRVIFLLVATAVLTFLIVGCAETPPRKPLDDVVLTPAAETVHVPEATLKDCDPMPLLEDRPYTEKEVLEFSARLVTPVSDCRRRHRDLSNTTRKALNIKTSK